MTRTALADRCLDARARHYARAIALRFVKDEDAADDVAQEAMLLAHRHMGSFRGDSAFSTWLYRVTTTAALMYLRRQRRLAREVLASAERDEGGGAWLDNLAAPARRSDDALAAHQLCARAARRVDRLGPKYGPVFYMRYRDGYSETEIARRLGLSLATVKTRAHRAKVAAREAVAA
ncbi:MAG: sigma-70 family RNA polymerase sigma factor [Deltaproteobacteria bacterium]|nr:sigma-70 family RNA polymerase sigma factor [Kofleriaceae bacterium]